MTPVVPFSRRAFLEKVFSAGALVVAAPLLPDSAEAQQAANSTGGAINLMNKAPSGVLTVTGITQTNGASGDSEFMNTLRNAMDQVGQLQSEADGKVAQLLTGNGQDVHSAMIAVEKASLAFQMMVQVRNKIVQAYQQVSSIPF